MLLAYIFKNDTLNFIRPSANKIFNCQNLKNLKGIY